jgi:hypothetical protein
MDQQDPRQDYWDDITKSSWPAGWWIVPAVVLGAAMIALLIWAL